MSQSSSATIKNVRSPDGTAIYAEAVGNPRNPPVVFIHEVTFSSTVFDELMHDRRLVDHLYLVRYDLRCHGRSGMASGENGHQSTCYADDFCAVVRAFGLQRPIVVAWGIGAATVADVCAVANPNPIAALVFVAPLPFLRAEMPRLATERMLGVAQVLCSTQDAVVAARAKTEFIHGVFAGSACRIPDAVKASWLGQSIAQPPEVTRRVLSRQQDSSRLLEAGRRGLPLMVLVGSQDALVDGAAAIGELRRHYRNAEMHVVEGGSHALFVDRKDEFVKLLLVFVGKLAVMTLMG